MLLSNNKWCWHKICDPFVSEITKSIYEISHFVNDPYRDAKNSLISIKKFKTFKRTNRTGKAHVNVTFCDLKQVQDYFYFHKDCHLPHLQETAYTRFNILFQWRKWPRITVSTGKITPWSTMCLCVYVYVFM